MTGLDLVELQLRVAAGEPLPDLSRSSRRGCAVEARVYAEDPSKGFIPKPGTIDELVWGAGGGVADAVCGSSRASRGSKVTPFYDPMIAKVAAWGESRAAAIDELARALDGTTIAPVDHEYRVLEQFPRHPRSAPAPTTRASPRHSPSARAKHAAGASLLRSRLHARAWEWDRPTGSVLGVPATPTHACAPSRWAGPTPGALHTRGSSHVEVLIEVRAFLSPRLDVQRSS